MFSLDFTAQVLVLNGVFNGGDTISAGTSFSLSNLTIRDFDSGGNDLEVTTFSSSMPDGDSELFIDDVGIGGWTGSSPVLTLQTNLGSITGSTFVFAGQTYFFADNLDNVDLSCLLYTSPSPRDS